MISGKHTTLLDLSVWQKFPQFNWLCIYLQKLCDYVSELLLEESNVQPVSTPVTVCGDIHGQVCKCIILFNIFS